MDPDEPVVIRVFDNMLAAEVARAVLESADIACMVIGSTYPEGPETVRLAVRRDQIDEAIAELDPASRDGRQR